MKFISSYLNFDGGWHGALRTQFKERPVNRDIHAAKYDPYYTLVSEVSMVVADDREQRARHHEDFIPRETLPHDWQRFSLPTFDDFFLVWNLDK